MYIQYKYIHVYIHNIYMYIYMYTYTYACIYIHTHITQKQESYCLWPLKWFIESFSNFEMSNAVNE